MVKLDIDGVVAVIDRYVWSCEDAGMLKWLNLYLDDEPPGPNVPDPDMFVAEQVVRDSTATILEHEKPEFVAGRIY